MVRRLVLFMGGAFLASCSANSTDAITRPLTAADAAVSLDKGQGTENKLTQSVDGHAAYAVTIVPGETEEYSVNAKRRADGTVFGELELKQQRAGAQYHIRGVMACITATGTTARLAARVVYSDQPNVQAGQYLAWTVVDNDVNDHDHHQPDLTTEFFLFDQVAAQLHCDSGFNLAPLYPIKGHLEVRDAATEQGVGNK